MFFPMAPVRTASALSGSIVRCSALKMEDDIVRIAQGVDEVASHETTLRLSYGFRGELTVCARKSR